MLSFYLIKCWFQELWGLRKLFFGPKYGLDPKYPQNVYHIDNEGMVYKSPKEVKHPYSEQVDIARELDQKWKSNR